MPPKRRSSMRGLSNETKKQVDRMLSDEEAELLSRTTIDFESLRPQVSDTETYDKLIAVVKDATDRNLAVTQLKERLQQLGKKGIAVAKQVAALIKSA